MFIGNKETKTFRWIETHGSTEPAEPAEQLESLKSYLTENYKIEWDGNFYSFIECPEQGLLQICQTARAILNDYKVSRTALDKPVTPPPSEPSFLARIFSAIFPCFFKKDVCQPHPLPANRYEMYKTEVSDKLNQQYEKWWKHYEKVKKFYSVKTWEEARGESLKLKEEINLYLGESDQNLEERLHSLLRNPSESIENFLSYKNPPIHLLIFVLSRSPSSKLELDDKILQTLRSIPELKDILRKKNLDL